MRWIYAYNFIITEENEKKVNEFLRNKRLKIVKNEKCNLISTYILEDNEDFENLNKSSFDMRHSRTVDGVTSYPEKNDLKWFNIKSKKIDFNIGNEFKECCSNKILNNYYEPEDNVTLNAESYNFLKSLFKKTSKDHSIYSTVSKQNKIFIDEDAKNKLDNDFKGLEFKEKENMFELIIENYVEGVFNYQKSFYKIIDECQKCDKIFYETFNIPQVLNKEIMEKCDFDIFRITIKKPTKLYRAENEIVISERFLKILKKNRLDEYFYIIPYILR